MDKDRKIRLPVLSSYLLSNRRATKPFLSLGCTLRARPWPLSRSVSCCLIPSCFTLQALTPIFFRLFSASSSHLFLDFPTDLPSGIFLPTFFTVLSSDILSTFPNHCNLPLSNFWDNIWLCIQFHKLLIGVGPPCTIFPVLGQVFFLNIFLPSVDKVFSSPSLGVRTWRTIHYCRSGYCPINMFVFRDSTVHFSSLIAPISCWVWLLFRTLFRQFQ